MVKNSDVLFGRTAATYKFVSREDIKMCVVEVSTSRVLGIKRYVSQVMYERGLLSTEQIFAVYYSMIRSQQIKKVRNYRVCEFTFADDEILYNAVGAKEKIPLQENENSAEEFKKKFAIGIEEFNLCIDIQKKLENAGIKTPLLNILFHKKLLSNPIKEIISDATSKISELNIAKDFTSKTVKKSIAILINQIAIINNRMTTSESSDALQKWENTLEIPRLSLKYLEVCFYLGFLSIADCQKIASFLKKVSGIEYGLRFHLVRLSDKEQEFFDLMQKENQLKESVVEEGKEIKQQFAKFGIDLPLPDILMLKGNLKRESIAKKWANSQRIKLVREIAENDKDLDGTVQAPIKLPAKEEADPQEFEETEEFAKELDETFRTSQTIQKKALQNEIQNLRARLKRASPVEVKTINTIIGHYQKADQAIKKTIFSIAAVVFFIFVGIFIAYQQKPSENESKKNTNNTSQNKIKPKKQSIEQLYKISRAAINKYQFLKVHSTYLKIISQNNDEKQNKKLSMRAGEFHSLNKLISSLNDIINIEKKVIILANKSVYIENITPEHFLVKSEQEGYKIPRENITPLELYNLLSTYLITQKYPWETALFCYEYNLPSYAKKLLISFVERNPHQKNLVWQLMSNKTSIPIPEGGYVVYKGEIISHKQHEKIQKNLIAKEKKRAKEQIEQSIPKKEVSPLQVWENRQKESLRIRRSRYIKEVKEQGYVFYNKRWTSPSTVKKENEVYEKMRRNFVWFNDEWHLQSSLGKWTQVTYRKELLTGYISQNTDSKLYTLRTKQGIRYLSQTLVRDKKSFPAPWESYWLLAKKIPVNDIHAQYELGLWCKDQNLKLPAQIQFELVLTQAPNHRGARHYLGFNYINERWYFPQENITQKLNFAQQTMSYLQARYYGIVVHQNKTVIDFSILDYKKPSQQNINEQKIAQEIFGGTPQRTGKRWRLAYNFSSSMKLGAWENVTRGKTSSPGAIINEYLEVTADDTSPAFAHLAIPFIGRLQVKYKGQIAPRSKYNLYTKIYHENPRDSGGYLFALNWKKNLQDKNSQNVIQSYEDGRFEIIDLAKSPTIPSGKNYRININAHKGKLSLDLSGGRLLNARENTTYEKGGISFGTFDSRVRFDDIVILGQIDENWFQEQVIAEKTKQLEKSEDKNIWINGIAKSLSNHYIKLDSTTRSSLINCYKLFVSGNLISSRKLIDEILAAYPQNPFVLLTRARIHNEMKNYIAAIKDSSDVIQILKDNNDEELYTAYIVRGIARNFLQQRKDALQDYLQAQTLAPEELLPNYMLCNWYLQNNDIKKGQEILKTYLGQDKSNEEAKQIFSTVKKNESPYVFKHYLLTEKNEIVSDYLQESYDKLNKIMKKAKSSQTVTVEISSSQQTPQSYLDHHLFIFPRRSNVIFMPLQNKIVGSSDTHNDIFTSELHKASLRQLIAQQDFPNWLQEGLLIYLAHYPKFSLYHYLKTIEHIRSHQENLHIILNDESFYGINFEIHRSLSYTWIHFFLNSRYKDSFINFLYETSRKGQAKKLLYELVLQKRQKKIHKEFIKFWENLLLK
ncbi:tetratricopeptide repeat protein [Candidatus Uabimicrobium sp. HlEnr_7]|uniref:tetratricopeptide repeat protein n=1 Tax=Candidatus Uabimicrobium helgolandensis TaxID=3095367 RepID=UPI003557A87B